MEAVCSWDIEAIMSSGGISPSSGVVEARLSSVARLVHPGLAHPPAAGRKHLMFANFFQDYGNR